jgi:hypothetical protein
MPPKMTDGATDPTQISLTRTDVENVLSRFRVRLTDSDGSSTEHEVTVSRAEWERFGEGYRTPEELVEASFRFLLERESKDQILGAFGLGQIGTYFPSYDRDIDPTA